MDKVTKSASLLATGTIVSVGQARLTGMYFRATATNGSLVFRNGGASGPVICTVYSPAAKEGDDVTIPGAGIQFQGALHVTLTDIDGLTVFYEVDVQ